MRLSKQNKIVVGVIAFILALTVGYALFSESLNINGTAKASGDFGLEFVSVDAIRKEGYTDTSSNGSASEEEIKQKIASIVDVNGKKNRGLSVTVDKLNYPGAYVEIDATIKNVGTIDAILTGIEVTSENGTVNDKTISNDDIEITYTGVNENDVMKADENDSSNKRQITIKVKWKESSANKSPSALTFNIGLNFEQATGNLAGGTTGGGDVNAPLVVEGNLGDKVNFYYNDGIVNLSGTGDMWEIDANEDKLCSEDLTQLDNGKPVYLCPLSSEIGLKLSEKYGTGVSNIDKAIAGAYQLKETFCKGNTYCNDDLLKQQLMSSYNLTDDEASRALTILNTFPEIKSITIENGITSLRGGLFYFSQFDSIEIPKSVAKMSKDVFSQANIKNLSLENGATKVPSNFADGLTVNNINIPEGVTEIETEAIDCRGLTKLIIPSTVTVIGKNSINGSDLTEVVNKTGKAFDWYNIFRGGTGEPFVTGLQHDNYGKDVSITSGNE